ncbi:hypothetical protein [Oceanivirga salmonicida]|uniref:hypothetical protein n=1 Tax=Oceanivirga salmonicida TaxID=1769291 RepID=UPI0012E2E534|nr:hypothetical protein [Oceanivirga salmonicida]
MRKRILTILLMFLGLMSFAKKPIDYISAGRVQMFNGEKYELRFSYNPIKDYFKQEYNRKEDQSPNYVKMIIIDILKVSENEKLSDIVAVKYNSWKEQGLLKYFKVLSEIENEIIYEFILNSNEIHEYNIYREKITNGYLVLYAYSQRGYIHNEKEFNEYKAKIIKNKDDLFKKIKEVKLPVVKIKK